MTTNYRGSSAATITLASLASDTNQLAGACSSAIDNSTNKDDFLIPFLKVRAGTSPTAARTVELWAFAQRADGTWPELFGAAYSGTSGAFTAVSRDILWAGAILLGSVTTDATTGRDYVVRGREIAQAFGAMPKNIAFFVVHNMGVALDSTGANHALTINPGNYT